MTPPRWIRRSLAGVLGITGLAYPACAAVCPRGIGGCQYPGRCFLFVDGDANSLCDYTSRSAVSSPPSTNVQDPVATPVPGGAVPAAPAGTPTPGSGSLSELPHLPLDLGSLPVPLLIGIAAGITLFIVFFLTVRSGILGIRTRGSGPALVVSFLFALGTSETLTFFLFGEGSSGSVFAVVYMLAGTLATAYLWKSGHMTRPLATAVAIMSTLFGFVILAPLMPVEFAALFRLATASQALAPGVVGILAAIALAFLVGRTFCGHICPVGSVQELAWNMPGKKVVIPWRYLEAARAIVFVGSCIAALFMVNIMAFSGVGDFFSLAFTTGTLVFAALLVLSTIVYRPVCRGLCPFGLLFSVVSHVSTFRLERTGACLNCSRCEKACPAGVAGKDAPKRECYLCGRCKAVCPAKGAIVYKIPHTGDGAGKISSSRNS